MLIKFLDLCRLGFHVIVHALQQGIEEGRLLVLYTLEYLLVRSSCLLTFRWPFHIAIIECRPYLVQEALEQYLGPVVANQVVV